MIVEVEALEEALEPGVRGDRLDRDTIALDGRDSCWLWRCVSRGELRVILEQRHHAAHGVEDKLSLGLRGFMQVAIEHHRGEREEGERLLDLIQLDVVSSSDVEHDLLRELVVILEVQAVHPGQQANVFCARVGIQGELEEAFPILERGEDQDPGALVDVSDDAHGHRRRTLARALDRDQLGVEDVPPRRELPELSRYVIDLARRGARELLVIFDLSAKI